MGTPYALSSDLVSAWPAKSKAVADYLDPLLAAKAPSASPTFTGTVTLTGTTIVGLPAPGLTLLATATATAASSVSINNVFAAGYDNYLLVARVTNSAGNYIRCRLRASGSDNSSAAYSFQELTGNASSAGATRATAQTSIQVTYADTTPSTVLMHLFSPFLAAETMFSTHSNRYNGGNPIVLQIDGLHSTASSFDGLTVYPDAGTFTTPTNGIRVYGYSNS